MTKMTPFHGVLFVMIDKTLAIVCRSSPEMWGWARCRGVACVCSQPLDSWTINSMGPCSRIGHSVTSTRCLGSQYCEPGTQCF